MGSFHAPGLVALCSMAGKQCAVAGCAAAEKSLKRCPCKLVWYCGRAHQKSDRASHKQACMAVLKPDAPATSGVSSASGPSGARTSHRTAPRRLRHPVAYQPLHRHTRRTRRRLRQPHHHLHRPRPVHSACRAPRASSAGSSCTTSSSSVPVRMEAAAEMLTEWDVQSALYPGGAYGQPMPGTLVARADSYEWKVKTLIPTDSDSDDEDRDSPRPGITICARGTRQEGSMLLRNFKLERTILRWQNGREVEM